MIDCQFLARGSRGFTRYWDGESEMSQITGNKRNIGANSNLGFPMKLTIVLKFRFVVLSTSVPSGTFDFNFCLLFIADCHLSYQAFRISENLSVSVDKYNCFDRLDWEYPYLICIAK